jgi:hypothetical protein
VQDVADGCVDLVVARGAGAVEEAGTLREVQLVDAAALAYRVRAVRDDGTVSPWTEPVRVTTLTPAGPPG